MPEHQLDRIENANTLLNVVNKAASTVNVQYITFLTVGIYIGITVASTTDEMLIRQSTLALPILGTEIPIRGLFSFYSIAPWLIVLMHWHVLLQFALLGIKLMRFEEEIRLLKKLQVRNLCLRDQLDNFYYLWIHSYSCLGPKMRLLRKSFYFILWITLLILPMILLLWIQARFLAIHSDWTTFGHRFAILADIVLLWLFWARIMRYHEDKPYSKTKCLMNNVPLVTMFVAVMAFSWLVATIPGTDEEPKKDSWGLIEHWLPTDFVEKTLLQTIHRHWFKFRNLDLENAILTNNQLKKESVNESINAIRDGDTEQMLQALKQLSPLSSFQGRDIRYANLFKAVLPWADLRADTLMQYANLGWAQMQKSLLDDARLNHANLSSARLEYASMLRTDLQDADLSDTSLQRARLLDANLQDATLIDAKLQGADLSGAHLERADLRGADLRGAFLNGAKLKDAKLPETNLQDVNLSGTDLEKQRGEGKELDEKGKKKKNRIDLIAKLACSDAYIAEGLIHQINQMENLEWIEHEDQQLILYGMTQAPQHCKCQGKERIAKILHNAQENIDNMIKDKIKDSDKKSLTPFICRAQPSPAQEGLVSYNHTLE